MFSFLRNKKYSNKYQYIRYNTSFSNPPTPPPSKNKYLFLLCALSYYILNKKY